MTLFAGVTLSGAVFFFACPGKHRVDPGSPRAPLGPQVVHTDGTPVGLAEIAPGQRVAVVVMKGNWCSVCTDQLLRLQERQSEFAGAAVVGINHHEPKTNAMAAKDLGINLPLLSDVDLDAIRSFGLEGSAHPVPGVVLIDQHGQVAKVVKGRYPGCNQEDWIIDWLTK